MPYQAATGWFLVRTAGRVLEASSRWVNIRKREPVRSKRGAIESWSSRSRGRLIKTLEAIDWLRLGPLFWITLTYPAGEWSAKESKRHLAALRRRWARRWGKPVGAWKMEFQRRGVVHFHLLLVAPVQEVGEFRVWLSSAWAGVVRSLDARHLHAGTSCDWWATGKAPVYFAGYSAKASKEYQNKAPEGSLPGRWWGLWGVKPDWKERRVTVRQFVRLRRYLKGLRQARNRGRRVRSPQGLRGTWTYGEGLERLLALEGIGDVVRQEGQTETADSAVHDAESAGG